MLSPPDAGDFSVESQREMFPTCVALLLQVTSVVGNADFE